MTLAAEGDLSLRLMRDDEADYAVMAHWLSDPRVLEFYEGRNNPYSIQRIREEYSPREMIQDGVTPCLFMLNGKAIGYAQFYSIDENGRLEYELGEGKNLTGLFGIDQFIGEPALWGAGFGTRGVKLLLRYLFEVRGAREVILDPRVENKRAIHCYKRCGFREVKLLQAHELHEGMLHDCLLMSYSSA